MTEEIRQTTPEEDVILDSVAMSRSLVEAVQKIKERVNHIENYSNDEVLKLAKSISLISTSVAQNHANVIRNTISLRESYIKQEAMRMLKGGINKNACARFPQPQPIPQLVSANESTKEKAVETEDKQENCQIVEQSNDGKLQDNSGAVV